MHVQSRHVNDNTHLSSLAWSWWLAADTHGFLSPLSLQDGGGSYSEGQECAGANPRPLLCQFEACHLFDSLGRDLHGPGPWGGEALRGAGSGAGHTPLHDALCALCCAEHFGDQSVLEAF